MTYPGTELDNPLWKRMPTFVQHLLSNDDPVTGRLVLIAGSRAQRDVRYPVAAFDLYEGPRVVALRQRLGGVPAFRRQVRLLSARHGLLHADQVVAGYRQPLTLEQIPWLRGQIAAELQLDWVLYGVPAEVLVIAGPLWMAALGGVLALPERPRVRLWTESPQDWSSAMAVLDSWGWP